MRQSCSLLQLNRVSLPWLLVAIIVLGYITRVQCMTADEISALKQEARDIFYHGLDNYFKHAWPEDELRPLTCTPMTRDRANPYHFEVNDALGNYSLSMVDSLSTLAILASSPTSDHDGHNALVDFQTSISLLVEQYGDGSTGPAGQGVRARGFDLDSKVQVFETTIRGVGGLLSAHLFAVGDLPIRGYSPVIEELGDGRTGIVWSIPSSSGDSFVYDGQLLRLALDLGKRLLPAFHTPTGIPYPRVNLRKGIPFYQNSPLNNDAETGQCDTTETPKDERERTETCSAGAGSLVLEFAVLSRLTGDERFETLAKKAFWAIWERRASTGLIGSGIDAETGDWISGYTGIGAGIDSFFEYAFKSHILLSGLEKDYHEGATDVSSLVFLDVWNASHAAIKRHIYRGPHFRHPHYGQNDMWSGGPRLAWVDSLSAYYPGLLTLAGEVEEATTAQLLYTALWTRYGALPERWNTQTGKVDGGLGWWGGRPEFIESNWYLYRATKDPWYLHVGQMAIKDIKRRCWTKCGWAGVQDVESGELTNRMESFFLGETAKYLYLLFDDDHPLNHLDAAFIFSTEGHPLLIPTRFKPSTFRVDADPVASAAQCPAPPGPAPFSLSQVASRPDVYHAAQLVKLSDTQEKKAWHDARLANQSINQLPAANRYTYPWTLPQSLIPAMGVTAPLAVRHTFDLTFPTTPSTLADLASLQRRDNGILMKSFSGLRLTLVLDQDENDPKKELYRIFALSGMSLGRDEGLWMTPRVLSQLNPVDPHLQHMKDTDVVDILLDVPVASATPSPEVTEALDRDIQKQLTAFFASSRFELKKMQFSSTPGETLLRALPEVLLSDTQRLAAQLDSFADLSLAAPNFHPAIREAASDLRNRKAHASSKIHQVHRYQMPAMLSYGPGAVPLAADSTLDASVTMPDALPISSILLLNDDLCDHVLPANIPRNYAAIIVRRGRCSFSEKLANIPSFPPLDGSLKIVLVIGQSEDDAASVYRPLLHEAQLTPSGTERRNGIPLLLVHAGDEAWDAFTRAASTLGHYDGAELVLQDTGVRGGLAIKRRVWFACNGVRIANLYVQ